LAAALTGAEFLGSGLTFAAAHQYQNAVFRAVRIMWAIARPIVALVILQPVRILLICPRIAARIRSGYSGEMAARKRWREHIKKSHP